MRKSLPARLQWPACVLLAVSASVRLAPSQEDPAPEAGVRSWKFEGRVLDSGRFPVPGIRMRLPIRAGATLTATTDERGRYDFDLGELTPDKVLGCQILAWDGKDRAASTGVEMFREDRVNADRQEVTQEDLVLGPARKVTVAVQREARPVPGATVELLVDGSLIGFVDRLRTGEDGTAVFMGLHFASWRDDFEVRAWTGGGFAGRARIGSPLVEDLMVQVALGPTRSLEVTVMNAAGNLPIAGAALHVSVDRDHIITSLAPLLPPVPTDASGRTRIDYLFPDDTLRINVRAAGFDSGDDVEPAPGQQEVRFSLKRSEPLRWRLVEGEVPPPPEGADVLIEPGLSFQRAGLDAECRGRIEGGCLVAPEKIPWSDSWLATAPDGAVALFSLSQRDHGIPEVAFSAPRCLEVVLRHEDGQPAREFAAEVRLQGEPGRDDGRGPLSVRVVTGAQGRAVRTGIVPGRYAASIRSWRGASIDAGVADLRAGDARIEAVLPNLRRIELDLRLPGRPGLPSQIELRSEDAWLRPAGEEPEKGRLICEMMPVRPGPDVRIHVAADGYLPATAMIPARGEGPARVTLDLKSTASVEVRFLAPEEQSVHFNVQSWSPTLETWSATSTDLLLGDFEAGKEYVRVAKGLSPGRHRLMIQEWTGSPATAWSTLPFEIRNPGDVVRSRIDLRRRGVIEGRIETPDPDQAGSARVVSLADGVRGPFTLDRVRCEGVPVRPDGSFTIRWLGDPPAALAAWHPVLRSLPDVLPLDGPGPHRDCVLRLAPGRMATFRPRLDLPAEFAEHGRLRVLLFDGEPAGAPAAEHEARWRNGVASFGGFPTGTWNLVVDPPSLLEFRRGGIEGETEGETWIRRLPARLPAVLTGVTLGDDAIDLGELDFERGLEIVVRIAADREGSAPPLRVEAEALDAPTYRRATTTRGSREVVLAGLRPGRVRVRVTWLARAGWSLFEEETTLCGGPPRVFNVKVP